MNNKVVVLSHATLKGLTALCCEYFYSTITIDGENVYNKKGTGLLANFAVREKKSKGKTRYQLIRR